MQRWRIDRRLSPRDRRAVWQGALVATPVLLYLLVLKPYVSGVHRASDELERQRILLEREEEITAGLPSIQADSLGAAAVLREATSRAYETRDTVAPIAAFGRDVAEAFEDAGLSVQRLEMRDSVERHASLEELTIDVRAEGDFSELVNALARLESNTRLIRISRLSIERSVQNASSPGESLFFTAILRGYAR